MIAFCPHPFCFSLFLPKSANDDVLPIMTLLFIFLSFSCFDLDYELGSAGSRREAPAGLQSRREIVDSRQQPNMIQNERADGQSFGDRGVALFADRAPVESSVGSTPHPRMPTAPPQEAVKEAVCWSILARQPLGGNDREIGSRVYPKRRWL